MRRIRSALAEHRMTIGATVLLAVIALVARVPDLDNRVNIDVVPRWTRRVLGFWEAVDAQDWAHTFQSGHPGVTFMWLVGGTLRLFGLDSPVSDPHALGIAKLPIAVFGALVAPATFLMLRRLLGAGSGLLAFVTGLLIATEPFLVAHSRSLHLDMLVTGFAWLAVLASALALRGRSLGWAVAAGICLGLACLTKIYAAAIVAGIVSLYAMQFVRSRFRAHELSTLLIVMGVTTIAVMLIGWPALLHHPVDTLVQMSGQIGDGMKVGIRRTRVFRWGEITQDDPGLSLYAGVALMRVSPEVLWAAVLGLVATVWHPQRRTLAGILWMELPLAVLLLWASRKGDRYFLTLYPVLCLFAATTIVVIAKWLAARTPLVGRGSMLSAAMVGALLLGRGARLFAVHPLPVSWCASYPGLACEDVLTLGWGEGMKEVAEFIKKDSPHERPRVFPRGYTRCTAPWLDAKLVRRPKRAAYLVSYLSEKQRNYYTRRIRRYARGQTPIFTVVLDGRVYAEVYRGPLHSDYPRAR